MDLPLSFFDESSSSSLKNLLKETVLKILSLIKHTCKNYPEKIKNFLMEYNSYVILKKLPGYFDNDERIVRKSSKLIKIQLPYFTKKKKNTAGNMKMITEIYGKFLTKTNNALPEESQSTESISFSIKNPSLIFYFSFIFFSNPMEFSKLTDQSFDKSTLSISINSSRISKNSQNNDYYLLKTLDKYEKNNFKNCPLGRIDSTDVLRKIHAEFNNKHYLKPEYEVEDEEQEDKFTVYNRIMAKLWNETQLDDGFKNSYQGWLEENVWGYYD